MRRLTRLLVYGLFAGMFSCAANASTHTFLVKVHRKVSPGATQPQAGQCQIMAVKFTMSFATLPGSSIAGITLKVTEPDSPNQTLPSGTGLALSPSMSPASLTFPTPPTIGGVTPVQGDVVQVSAPDKTNLAGYDTAHFQRYEIDFNLASNYNLSTNHSTQEVDPETYTLVADVTTLKDDGTTGDPATVSGTCIESYDGRNRSSTTASCGAQQYYVPITDPSQTELSVDGTSQAAKQCFRDRPGVDAILVLDKSGSMAGSTLGSSARPKIEALQGAVRDFVSTWDDTRSFFDPTPPNNTTPPNDQIGLVLFDSAASTWTDGGLAATGLNTFAGADTKIKSNLDTMTCSATSCGQLIPGTSTSIGAGLLSADGGFPSDTNRHVVLLMSDGMQNTDPMVTPYDPTSATPCASATPKTVATFTSGNCGTAAVLPHASSSNYQIHTVTVGTGLAVSAAINQQIAQLSGGFYINTEDNSDQLKPFFLELLQNTLKFNSYETLRMISETASPTTLPFTASMPISTTSHDVEFNLMWPRASGALRLTISPPGAASPIVKEDSSGFISIARELPLSPPYDPLGDWGIRVEFANVPVTTAAVAQQSFPFEMLVMADDGAVKSDLSIVPADYKTGDKIRLRAKLTDLGLPILKLGSHPNDKIQANLIKPGESIGDILSDSTASSTSSSTDPQSPAEAKLSNTLQTDPSALKHVSDIVQLYDDGKPEHGDDVAGDGIYSALYPADISGHYSFLFSIESTDPAAARFSRQQMRTAFVRAVPDSGSTIVQSSIAKVENTKALLITLTPRVKAAGGCAKANSKCGRMGPGWGNYFWFTVPGRAPLKATDKKLDGTYTASIPFTGSTPPRVGIHFENVVMTIGDDVTPDHLPQPLDGKNTLTTCCGTAGRFAVSVDAGANLFSSSGTVHAGFSVNGGLEYLVNPHFSIEGIVGYHRFAHSVLADPNLYQFSLDGKVLLSTARLRPFVHAGAGAYKFGSASTYAGGNVGFGLLYEVSSRVGVQGTYNFHVVNTPAVTKFSTLQAGLRFTF